MGKFFLIGIPNCGKSTLGRLTADILKLPFFDTDTMARDRLKPGGSDSIFSSVFKQRFVDAQHAAIAELAGFDGDAIIATGAEISLMLECVQSMRTTGTIILIKRKPELVLEDLRNNGKRRIVLRDEANGMEIDMQENFVKHYMDNYSCYESIADLSLDNNGSEDEGVQKLVVLINQWQTGNI